MLQPGQRVICVDAYITRLGRFLCWLSGSPWRLVQTEQYVVLRSGLMLGSEPAVELVQPKNGDWAARCFLARRFRPLTQQDIQEFWTQGAPKDSERWDIPRRAPTRVDDTVSDYDRLYEQIERDHREAFPWRKFT